MKNLLIFFIVTIILSFGAVAIKNAGTKVLSRNVGRTQTMLADLDL